MTRKRPQTRQGNDSSGNSATKLVPGANVAAVDVAAGAGATGTADATGAVGAAGVAGVTDAVGVAGAAGTGALFAKRLPGDDRSDPAAISPLSVREEPGEEILPPSLRPRCFADFVGQRQVVEKLQIFIAATKQRREPLDHTLLLGPPGLGKTTLANVIAAELSVNIRITSGPILTRAGDVAALLTGLQRGDILFIDEIHRLSKSVEEVLYPAMEDYHFDVLIGKGPTARSLRMEVPPFTLIGATTREGDLTAPLRGRFGVAIRIDYYPAEELTELIHAVASRLGFGVDDDAALAIAQRSRGTPRVAIRLFRRMRDVAQVEGKDHVNMSVVERGMNMLRIDAFGLDFIDRKILEVLLTRFNGGPVSLDTLAVSVGEEADTVYDVYEAFLIQSGFLARTPRGRVATTMAYEYFGMQPPVVTSYVEQPRQSTMFED